MYLYEKVEHSAPLAPNGFRPLGRRGGGEGGQGAGKIRIVLTKNLI